METVFDLADELGPSKVIHVHEPLLGLATALEMIEEKLRRNTE